MTEATSQPASAPRPAFAHASEAELARILDFYEVRWRYEPDTFPIGWNLDGEVVESFAPDFFLPDLDLYVELTTLKQSLVRRKNRKLRRLRELYPDVRIKLLYARDFRMLLLKFGRLALADELSGTTGQATPPRARAVLADVSANLGALAAEDAEPAADLVGDFSALATLSGPPDAVGGESGRSSRNRRRRRRRAAVRAAAQPVGSSPHAVGVIPRPPDAVPSGGRHSA